KGFGSGRTNYTTVGWNSTHQVMKLRFYGVQVGKNIGMVVFEIVQDGRTRTIMHELRTLVEECRVVFVRFNHEVRFRGIVTRRYFKIMGDSTDQEVGRHAGI